MFLYILKRILYFIPTFFVISIITFLLGQIAPGDPIELKLKGGMQSANQQSSEKLQTEKAYLEISEKYGRHLPPFYFTLSTSASPDTLYKIRKKSDRENLERIIAQYGNWDQISHYYYSVRKLEFAVMNAPKDTLSESTFEKRSNVRLACLSLYQQYEDKSIVNQLEAIKSLVSSNSEVVTTDSQKVSYKPLASLEQSYVEVENAYTAVKEKATPIKNYIPSLHWFGLGNQYHRWMFGDKPWFGENTDLTKTSSGLLRLDFGKSFLDDRPVASIIKDSLRWTLLLNLIVLLIVYIVSIPLGVAFVMQMESRFDRFMTLVLFLFYSLPIVWIGTLMITFFH